MRTTELKAKRNSGSLKRNKTKNQGTFIRLGFSIIDHDFVCAILFAPQFHFPSL